MTQPVVSPIEGASISQRRKNLLRDMVRDPEGHFHVSIGRDRRLPPQYGSDRDSLPPLDVQERLYRFIRDQCYAQNPDLFQIRHDWFFQTMNLTKWVLDWEFQDKWGSIALATWTPVELYGWPDSQSWLPGGEALFDYLWQCFLSNDADTRRNDRRAREIAYAKKFCDALADKVAMGAASEQDLEEYEYQLRIAEPEEEGQPAVYELAKDLRRPLMHEVEDKYGL